MPTRPGKLTDLADAEIVPQFVADMREAKNRYAVPLALCEYAAGYFQNVPVGPEQIDSLAVFVADHTYRFAAQVEVIDEYVHAYVEVVHRYLWDCIRDRGVRVFYILDNTIREDRFTLAYGLFRQSGMSVVSPYDWEPASWELVARDLGLHLAAGRHIAYIEKDASVNYLDRVLQLARRSRHTIVVRDRAPGDPTVTRIDNEPVS